MRAPPSSRLRRPLPTPASWIISVALAAAAIAGSAREARCSCGARPAYAFLVADLANVPTNALLPVIAHGRGNARYSLTTTRGAPVAIEVTRLGTGEDRVVLLRPVKRLDPDTTYRLIARRDKERARATFSTARGPDTRRPRLAAVVSARYQPVDKGRIVRGPGGRKVYQVDLNASGEPAIDLTITPAQDDLTPGKALRYAVWIYQPGRPPHVAAADDPLGVDSCLPWTNGGPGALTPGPGPYQLTR